MRTLTKRLAIEPLTLAHADELIGLTDPLVNAHFPAGDAPTDLHLLRSQFEAMLAGPTQPRPGERFLNHAVRRIDTGHCIGRLEAFVHGNTERDAEVAFLFVPESWGYGYASEAVQWLLTHVAAEHDVLRFWACVTPSNQRSLALLHRLGFSVTAEDRGPNLASHEDGDVVLNHLGMR